ncbi:cysteine-rich KTR domain-containing protein [Paenibacillus sp. USHLN196]
MLCPVCDQKPRIKMREDTAVENFNLSQSQTQVQSR